MLTRLSLLALSSVGAPWLGAQQARDSAGVHVVKYSASATARGHWTLDPRPLLTLGGADGSGPTEFAEISGVVRLSDGRVAVANEGSTEIRLFGADGRYERSVGRRGQGPGEFHRLFGLRRAADTLVGIDNDGRAQLFAPNGDLVRSETRPRVPQGEWPTRLGYLRDGSMVLSAVDIAGDSARRAPTPLVKVVVQRPDQPPGPPLFRANAYQRIEVGGRPTYIRYGARAVLVAADGRICAGYSGRYAISCYEATGRLVLRIERALEGRPITEADQKLFAESYLGANKGAPPAAIKQIEELNRIAVYAERAPVFGKLVLSTGGELWVSEFRPEGDILGTAVVRSPRTPVKWNVYTSDGLWLSDVTLPGRFTPYDMGRDYVAGVSFGDDDIETITIYRILR